MTIESNKSTATQGYNGWTNWETWATNLHFDDCFNDEAQAAWDDAEANATFTREENAAFVLAAAIKVYIEDQVETARKQNNFINEIIGGFIGTVNFLEIAQHYDANVNKENGAA